VIPPNKYTAAEVSKLANGGMVLIGNHLKARIHDFPSETLRERVLSVNFAIGATN